MVPGYSRLTWDELQKMVDEGYIKETYNANTGKYSYSKVK
jgi:hypothetical protein